jgi:hypothetical protein
MIPHFYKFEKVFQPSQKNISNFQKATFEDCRLSMKIMLSNNYFFAFVALLPFVFAGV